MMRDGHHDTSKVLLWPSYKLDEKYGIDREIYIPPTSLYMPLGWDQDAKTKRKHYRLYYEDELENVQEVF